MVCSKHRSQKSDTHPASEGDAVSLHGGPIGWDALPWTVTTTPQLFSEAEKSQIKALPEGSAAIFHLRSPAGDQGFPGTVDSEVLVAVVPGAGETLGSAVIVYRARLQEPNTVTPVNLTQHWGFNLDASLQDGPVTVLDHKLTIKADHIAELKPNSLATHKFVPVSEAPAHAHAAKKIGEKMPHPGYDDYYLLAESLSSAALSSAPSRVPLEKLPTVDLIKNILTPQTKAEKTIILSGEKSDFEIAFESNQRGAMFYSNAWGDSAKGARKKAHGGSGVPDAGDAYGPGTAAFIEYHHPIAAFLDPKNKDGEDTLITSDELYHNYVRCEVKVKAA